MKWSHGVEILLSVVLLISLLFGCGDGVDSPKLPKVPPIGENQPKISWKEFIEAARSIIREHPGIKDEELSRLASDVLTKQADRKVYIPWMDIYLTNQEFVLGINNPRKAILTYLAATIAGNESRGLFSQEDVRGSPGWRTKEDAFRHSFWNVVISTLVSERWAQSWTNAHESEEDPNNRDTQMDLHNNAVGRYVYHQHRWSLNVANDCSRALASYRYTKMPFSAQLGACYSLKTLIYIRNNNEDQEGQPWTGSEQDNSTNDNWPNVDIDISLADVLSENFDIDEFILEWPGGSSDDGSTPDPSDHAAPALRWARISTSGNGRFSLSAKFSDNRSGVDKDRFWIQDPAYQWHQVGDWNFDNPSSHQVDMNGQDLVGVWKFFVEAYDKSGNHLDRTDTSQTIGWGAPWIENQSMEGPSSTGTSTYRADLDSFSGHDGVSGSELFYWIDGRSYRIGNRISGWRAEWRINPLEYSNMEKNNEYPLTLIIQGTNGVKADQIAAGYLIT